MILLLNTQWGARLSCCFNRLQYFARGSHAYHAQLSSTLKGKSVSDMNDEQVCIYSCWIVCVM